MPPKLKLTPPVSLFELLEFALLFDCSPPLLRGVERVLVFDPSFVSLTFKHPARLKQSMIVAISSTLFNEFLIFSL